MNFTRVRELTDHEIDTVRGGHIFRIPIGDPLPPANPPKGKFHP